MIQKVVGSIVALTFCGAIFADGPKKKIADNSSFSQGDILTDNRYPPAYNAPAKIDLRDNCTCPYNIFIDASFIYWYAAQDGMALATSADLKSDGIGFNQGAVELVQPFRYSPGFKAGLGLGFQEWELHSEYTWIRQKTFVSSSAPTNRALSGTLPIWLASNWYAQGIGANNEFVSATHLSSSWRLGIDLLDVSAGRPYYQSKIATISPYGGIRAAWIRQSLHIQAMVPAEAVSPSILSPQPTHSHNLSNSWGIGPMFGVSGHCLVGAGFRVEGDGGICALFTQYTTLSHKEDSAEIASDGLTIASILTTNYNCVRPMANLGLGLGWGKYLYCNKYHLDFALDYDFNIFWDQNMVRTLAEQFSLGISSSNDLFLHGLTVSGRFDF